MGEIIINPGTEPLFFTTEAEAIKNIEQFVVDCLVEKCIRWVRVPAIDYGEGRYAFILWRDTRCHVVQMPGLPLERIRFTDSPDQNPFDFPRLYVDGSSWLWLYAVLSDWEDWKEPE